jgi:repressor LexA
MLLNRPPTARQSQVLSYLRECLARSSVPPSRWEIAAHFGMTVNGVQRHLEALERLGLIRREPRQHRALSLTGGASMDRK